MRIAEIYRSVQGEGLLTGTDSVFVRTSGCNLRCWFCDTPFASWQPEGDDLAVPEIVRQVTTLEARHVVLTGGEPMLFAELVPLCAALRQLNLHITIETAGTLYLDLACDLMSISPKRANSTPPAESAGAWSERHERTRHVPAVIERLIAEHPYQFKFVIDSPADCDDVLAYLREFPAIERSRVLLMPQGVTCDTLATTGQWLEPYCQAQGLVFCPRKHIEWFGLKRGT
ncbi:MAG TPA: 7-carboxy-7-deazaguanine synthase QueE [Pirellulaceae bacterium]|nr:7-carboxy-7-deazaguanine synthase QueE [Pirellulaceae bacterium]